MQQKWSVEGLDKSFSSLICMKGNVKKQKFYINKIKLAPNLVY